MFLVWGTLESGESEHATTIVGLSAGLARPMVFPEMKLSLPSSCLVMYKNVHVCICICIYMYMFLYMYVYVCACIYSERPK